MNVDASKFMDDLLGGELTIGEAIYTIRVTEYADVGVIPLHL